MFNYNRFDEYTPDPPDDNGEKYEEVICTDCSGSGEGMYDGTRCSTCRGKGCVWEAYTEEDPEEPEDD